MCELFLESPNVVLEVLVPLEFPFYILDISLEFNLPVVLLLELLSKLVKFDTKVAAFFFEVLNLGLELEYFIL